MSAYKSRKRLIVCAAVLIPMLLLAGVLAVKSHIKYSISLPAGMHTKDDLLKSDVIIKATPTGQSYKTGLEDDDIEFRVVELEVTETLKGDASDTVKLLQTIGMDEIPTLKKGSEYLLFLEPYEGPIPKTEGAYVATSANWSYYIVDPNDNAAPLYDEFGELGQWIKTVSEKDTDEKDGTYSLVDWVRDCVPASS